MHILHLLPCDQPCPSLEESSGAHKQQPQGCPRAA